MMTPDAAEKPKPATLAELLDQLEASLAKKKATPLNQRSVTDSDAEDQLMQAIALAGARRIDAGVTALERIAEQLGKAKS